MDSLANLFSWHFVVLAAGAVGGLSNARAAGDLCPIPSMVRARAGGRPVVRMGLIGNLVLAVGSSGLSVWLLQLATGLWAQPRVGDCLALCVMSAGIGFASSRLVTDEADKRLLREAVRNACGSPAAPPTVVRSIEDATPWEVYTATTDLTPPAVEPWRIGATSPMRNGTRLTVRHDP